MTKVRLGKEYLLNGKYVSVYLINGKFAMVRKCGEYHRKECEFQIEKKDLIAFSRFPRPQRIEISEAEARRIERCQLGIQ